VSANPLISISYSNQLRGIRLNPLTIQVARCERVGLSAPTGAGKSSMLKSALGSFPRGNNWVSFGATTIDFLGQHQQLLPWYPVRRGTCVLGDVKQDVPGEEGQGIAKELRIEGLLDRLPSKMSGGERQLAALWSALCRGAELIVVDEPFTALDHESKSNAVDVLKKACCKLQCGLLVVSHDEWLLEALCTSVVRASVREAE
jgi:ABC-type nitrate/sulfonate/bicarbonate transport system ATPase subunit